MKLMLLFTACMLIHSAGMSGAWYLVAVIIAVIDVIISLVIAILVTKEGIKQAEKGKPGIKGTVSGGRGPNAG